MRFVTEPCLESQIQFCESSGTWKNLLKFSFTDYLVGICPLMR